MKEVRWFSVAEVGMNKPVPNAFKFPDNVAQVTTIPIWSPNLDQVTETIFAF